MLCRTMVKTVALAVAAHGAGAAAQVVDQFVYPAGSLNGLFGGAGWAVAWNATAAEYVGAPTLAHPWALPSAGLAARNTGTAVIGRDFAGTIGPGTPHTWMSFLFERQVANEPMTFIVANAADVLRLRVRLAADVSLQWDADPVVGPSPLASGIGITDLYVLHFVGGSTPGVELWVNPASWPLPTDLVAPLPATATSISTLQVSFGLGQAFDEFRVGDSVTSVAALGVSCYPNCDGSTTPPVLNVLDFACFLNRYASGDPYANCDGSTTPPVLNVLDFACFLNRYATGCT